ncbi:MAG TPA: GatB/YqeY domain-containing protein [Candidatus Paceibacterota bacterium]|nr:GatB/YqeY domain-containing protein [Candidatus Paceibacterota bacterium]
MTMQNIQATIKSQLIEAMRAKDAVRTGVIRGLMSAFTNELVAKGLTPQTPLPDEDALRVIERAAKQRKDSIQQFIDGGRPELADTEKAELDIIETYLPEMMSQDEIRVVAEAKKAELGITDKSKAGQFTGMLMKELKGKARGDDVKSVVDQLLA